MLMPNERAQAIELLTNNYQSHYMHYINEEVKKLLIYGHKGFANFSDMELMRAIQNLAKKNSSHDIQNFIQNIAIDKFVLENI